MYLTISPTLNRGSFIELRLLIYEEKPKLSTLCLSTHSSHLLAKSYTIEHASSQKPDEFNVPVLERVQYLLGHSLQMCRNVLLHRELPDLRSKRLTSGKTQQAEKLFSESDMGFHAAR